MKHIALTVALFAGPNAGTPPADVVPPRPPVVQVQTVDNVSVVGTWATVGNVVIGHYYNKLAGRTEECVWDLGTLRLLYGRAIEIEDDARVR